MVKGWRSGIPGAKALHLAAAHLSNIERPRSFTTALLEFLLPPRVRARTACKPDSNCVAPCSAMHTSITRSLRRQILRASFKS